MLVEAAVRNGAHKHFGNAVSGIEVEGEGMMLSLEDGDAIYADVVVNATGAKAATVAEMVGRVLPLDVFPGLLVRVAVPGKPLRHLLHTPRINARPDGPGYALLHHDSVDERLTDDFAGTEDPLCAELLERARLVLPALEEAELVEARFGMPGSGGRAFLRRRSLCNPGLLRGRDAQRRYARPTHRASAGA